MRFIFVLRFIFGIDWFAVYIYYIILCLQLVWRICHYMFVFVLVAFTLQKHFKSLNHFAILSFEKLRFTTMTELFGKHALHWVNLQQVLDWDHTVWCCSHQDTPKRDSFSNLNDIYSSADFLRLQFNLDWNCCVFAVIIFKGRSSFLFISNQK